VVISYFAVVVSVLAGTTFFVVLARCLAEVVSLTGVSFAATLFKDGAAVGFAAMEAGAGAAGEVVAGAVVTGLWAKAGVARAMAATANKGRKLKDIELSFI
jgi:endonuclease YncB( thermonuclease family)